ncbi:MAG: hypothetical protein U0I22_06225 [Treponema sp.]|nr:hypothetical protein [Treponema sp.]
MSIFPADCVESCDCRSKIICEENKIKYIAHNPNEKCVYKIKVDEGLIKEQVRCDWAVAVVSNEDFLEEIFLVELKGSDIDHAFEQITGTMSILSTKCSAKKWFARVVCSKVSSPQLNGINYKKLDKKLKELNKSAGELQRESIIVKTKVLEEKL